MEECPDDGTLQIEQIVEPIQCPEHRPARSED